MARLGVLLAASLAAAGTGTPAGAAPTGTAANRTAVHTAAPTSADQQRVRDYWTPERMRTAVPVDQLLPQRQVKPAPVPTGKPRIVGARPAAAPESIPNGGGPWSGGGAVTKTAGRVFFTFQGRNAACSGDAITSQNGSVVVTAGHCVKYQGSWHTNWTFVPGYDNGNKPYGTWAATKTLTTPQWEANEDINYDVGMAVVAPLDGRKLADAVGTQGVGFNQARGQAMYAFGYPAASPYDGSKLIYCSGNAIDDPIGLSNDLGLSCNMTAGSSGGPWFAGFNESAGTGTQESVNSFGYNFLPGYMFGPYFGSDAEALYNRAQTS